jgi:Ice-binding-like
MLGSAVHSLKTHGRRGFFLVHFGNNFLRRLIMNHHQKHFSARLIALAALFSIAPLQGAWAATAPDLGTAASFAVLGVGSAVPPSTAADATTAVTTTTSVITGDVGSAGAVTLTGSTINGNVILSGALTNTGSTFSGTSTPLPVQVINDFNTAYNNYAAIPCTGTLLPAYTGATLTLAPGVYCTDAAVTFTSTTLTLDLTAPGGDGSGTWIFRIGTLGTGALTGTNFTVNMANGGDSCNVSWWVAEASTMTTSGFQGDILAGAAITLTGLAGTATPFNGDIMAKAGVTVTDVTVLGCNASGGGGNGGHCDHGHHDGHDGDKDHHDKDHHDKDHKGYSHNPWGSNDDHNGDKDHNGNK